MGRLIDADKLKTVIHRAYSDDLEILDKIDEAETVEAILMEWIKKKRDEVVSNYKYIIDWLILEWEKEQGEIYNGN